MYFIIRATSESVPRKLRNSEKRLENHVTEISYLAVRGSDAWPMALVSDSSGMYARCEDATHDPTDTYWPIPIATAASYSCRRTIHTRQSPRFYSLFLSCSAFPRFGHYEPRMDSSLDILVPVERRCFHETSPGAVPHRPHLPPTCVSRYGSSPWTGKLSWMLLAS